jgi:hypothetical protein
LKALKERLKKPDDEDVTTQWAMDRNTNDTVPLIQQQQQQQTDSILSNQINETSTDSTETEAKQPVSN